MPGVANLRVENRTEPKPGESGWTEEAGKPVHEIIAVRGDRAFFTMSSAEGNPGPATVQLWSRWKPPVKQYLIEIREPEVGEQVLNVWMGSDNKRHVDVNTRHNQWNRFPETSLVILHQGTGFKP